jgi:hypothetical protein
MLKMLLELDTLQQRITVEVQASIFPNLLFVDDKAHVELAHGIIVLYYDVSNPKPMSCGDGLCCSKLFLVIVLMNLVQFSETQGLK